MGFPIIMRYPTPALHPALHPTARPLLSPHLSLRPECLPDLMSHQKRCPPSACLQMVSSLRLCRYLDDLRVAASTDRLELMGLGLRAVPAEVHTPARTPCSMLHAPCGLCGAAAPPAPGRGVPREADALTRWRADARGGDVQVCALTRLTALLLSSNAIRELALGVCGMQALTELWLSHNHLARFPREACERLTALTALRIDHNRIAVVPPQMGELTNLTDLRLHGNSVTILPLECGDLARLQTLHLDLDEMVSPYPEVCARGANIIVQYLRAIKAARTSRVVDLRGLGLTSFPVEIYSIPSITVPPPPPPPPLPPLPLPLTRLRGRAGAQSRRQLPAVASAVARAPHGAHGALGHEPAAAVAALRAWRHDRPHRPPPHGFAYHVESPVRNRGAGHGSPSRLHPKGVRVRAPHGLYEHLGNGA